MYIEHIPTTKHLTPVREALRAIKATIDDKEWHGQDATRDRLQLERLQRLWAAGVRYEPNF